MINVILSLSILEFIIREKMFKFPNNYTTFSHVFRAVTRVMNLPECHVLGAQNLKNSKIQQNINT